MWYVIDVVRDRYAVDHVCAFGNTLWDALGAFWRPPGRSGTLWEPSGGLRDALGRHGAGTLIFPKKSGLWNDVFLYVNFANLIQKNSWRDHLPFGTLRDMIDMVRDRCGT